ncbi:MAG: 5'(3')-deoxyribonucleotidase [Saprospirales bacterium]|nr:5'(3')-deoxyribonucleotidase [Saprospirales bacterium]MBK8489877.1 5'(3')-deoxyribonucleotidase [Saprospirales bacterium]
MRIALDMDEVIADVLPAFLDLYATHFGVRLEKEDYWGEKIYRLPGASIIRESLWEKGFFADLPVVEGSQEVVRWLTEHYDVFIVTAAMEFRNSLEDKFDWMQRHFPFLHWKNFVFCGDKSIVQADYMIDDHPFNLEAFHGKGLLFTASHNVSEQRFERVNNWNEVRVFFEEELKRETNTTQFE